MSRVSNRVYALELLHCANISFFFFPPQFGGKLLSFGYEASQICQTGMSHTVYVSQVVTEPELMVRSNQLETVLQYGQYSDFCQAKIASSTASHERAVWNFLRASFETNSRAEFLSLLGFKPDEINSKVM
jgi:protein transport protein SEC31